MADETPSSPPPPPPQEQAPPPPPFEPDQDLIGYEQRGDDRRYDDKAERR
jgi:hypothetical protein